MNIIEQIESPKLTLRMLHNQDAAEMQAMLARNKEHIMPWIPWIAEKEPETIMQKKETIRLWKSEFYADISYRYGIFSKETNKLVGLCFLFTRQGDGMLEIGYIIDYQHGGKGYATEASYALTKLSIEKLNTEKVLIICSKDNIGSAKVPEKLGFQIESVYKDVKKREDDSREFLMRWALYQEEFKELAKYEPTHFLPEDGWEE